MTSRGDTRPRQIGLAATAMWLIVLASDGATHARPEGVSEPNAAARRDAPFSGLMNGLSEGGVGFRPVPMRPMGSYRGFAAPSPHPSPRRGEGDDVSLAPSFQERAGHFPRSPARGEGDDRSLAPSLQEPPGAFYPSPPRGEGARRAGEGAEPRAQQKRELSPRAHDRPTEPINFKLSPGQRETVVLGNLKGGHTYTLLVTLESGRLEPDDRITAELSGAETDKFVKELHAGDSDFYLPYRPARDGQGHLLIARKQSTHKSTLPVRVEWREMTLLDQDQAAIEAEPNDSWRQANELRLGRDVYGSADDVDYLDNQGEGKSGLDWFRFEVTQKKPILVYFQLDLLDRDVSANLKVYTVDAKTGQPVPYLTGKDPMEIVHDRERERYSKHISRTLGAGVYYLEVNANHPDYILRTRVLPVPPYDEPSQAVEAGMHYIMNVGDAWFAQVPREGNIYVRAANMHDTATRCTACHPSSFSTEANLVAHRNGYPIRSKSNFQYVIDRLYNSITPLYGSDGLYWQRFIAIPLQAQGKQGGILLDFEREVSGQETKTIERFGPFLQRAWESRRDLPPDEQNGVIPLDSKFGFAWRDWRVLSELGVRARRDDFTRSATNIAAILGEWGADRQVENLQDRIHRLYAWWLIDRKKHANKIKRETGALLTLQNADGGWHEVDSGPGPSAVYTTGQLVWTLLRIGLPRDHPALAKALRYLLAQQQDFGGWFQTTTHENFRTPMRETRYAVMALAEAFPRREVPVHGWANRDDGPARLPRTDSLVHTLDDLENLWDVPVADRARFARTIQQLLADSEPMVRAAAAACLGRLGHAESASALASRLDDPSKIVWRAAAWALRRLGNQGLGMDSIAAALEDTNPRVRRGAARIFAYQFHGMDTRNDIPESLIKLTRDPDLWTRLQALRTLRQWFYRTKDTALARRIVDTYLARMAEPDLTVVRKNLSEGLYIMLDENLGGGVSLQKNIESLPASLRPHILHARRDFERDVLLTPVLAALERGNDLQRRSVLDAFDGSFFKGRLFARQPESMIDVGNDREFGFVYQPELSAVEATFARLLTADLPATARRQTLQLASFFKLPGRTHNPSIQTAMLRQLLDTRPDVREAAKTIVADDDFNPDGIEDDPARIALIQSALAGTDEGRQAVMKLIGRNRRLAARPEIIAAVRGLMKRDETAASFLPLLRRPVFHDAEVLAIVLHAWPRLTPPERLQAIEALLGRLALVNVAEPREQVIEALRRGVNDSSAAVRDRTLRGINSLPVLWAGKSSTKLLLSALADDEPALRRRGLTLASTKPGFWTRPDTQEHLKRLLVDPDPQVRLLALSTVERHGLIRREPSLARRVKALANDPELKTRALNLLTAHDLDPATIKADVPLSRPRLLSFSTFRRKVNPVFYQAGEDKHACANCHANHTILRIAEADAGGGFSGEQLMINYNSALKVVNLGEPEASLILRKPRSPQGQGGPDASSPTGLSHVGGPRWESTEHPGYRAILDWIREASASADAQTGSEKLSADSYAPGYEPARAGDGDLSTVWHTEFVGATPGYPHELVVDLGASRRVEGLLYIPRQDSPNGRVKDFEIRASDDGQNWSAPLAAGRWTNDPSFKHVALPGTLARYVQLRGVSEVEDRPFMSAAELSIDTTAPGGTSAPSPVSQATPAAPSR
jgi:cellulose synthase operon protein C